MGTPDCLSTDARRRGGADRRQAAPPPPPPPPPGRPGAHEPAIPATYTYQAYANHARSSTDAAYRARVSAARTRAARTTTRLSRERRFGIGRR